MQKRSALQTVAMAAAGVTLCWGVGTASAAPRFHGDVAGVATGPGHAFVVGNGLYLRFSDRRRDSTAYRVCWTGAGHKRCWRRTTAERRRVSRIFTAAPSHVGSFRVRWRVRGRSVASWTFHNGVGD